MILDQRVADRCRHARLGYLDGQPGTSDDVEQRLRELDESVRWWSTLANRLVRESLAASGESDEPGG